MQKRALRAKAYSALFALKDQHTESPPLSTTQRCLPMFCLRLHRILFLPDLTLFRCQQATNGKRQSVLCSRQFWRRNYFCHFLAGAESSWRRMAQSQVGKWHSGLLPGWNTTMHFLKFISEMQQCSTTGVGVCSIE